VETQTAAGVVVGTPVTTTAGVTSVVVGGLTNGTAYRFRVQATNAVGTGPFSALSNTVTPAPPITVPGAPTIGVATSGNASAIVRWTPPASNGGSPITGYDVQVFQGTAVVPLRTVAVAAGATSVTVTGLTNGLSYGFRVRARNVVGAGPVSARSVDVVPSTIPSAPGIGVATSGAPGGAVNATVRWTAPASNGGAAITSYQVTAFRMIGPITIGTVVFTVPSGTARSVTRALPAGSYQFSVRAVNAAGLSPASARSNTVTAQ
jgi:hypothetical protein